MIIKIGEGENSNHLVDDCGKRRQKGGGVLGERSAIALGGSKKHCKILDILMKKKVYMDNNKKWKIST